MCCSYHCTCPELNGCQVFLLKQALEKANDQIIRNAIKQARSENSKTVDKEHMYEAIQSFNFEDCLSKWFTPPEELLDLDNEEKWQ